MRLPWGRPSRRSSGRRSARAISLRISASATPSRRMSSRMIGSSSSSSSVASVSGQAITTCECSHHPSLFYIAANETNAGALPTQWLRFSCWPASCSSFSPNEAINDKTFAIFAGNARRQTCLWLTLPLRRPICRSEAPFEAFHAQGGWPRRHVSTDRVLPSRCSRVASPQPAAHK